MSNLVMDDLRWYKIFIVKFKMSACDDSFISCISEHFLNTARRDLFHSMGWAISSYLVHSTRKVRKLKLVSAHDEWNDPMASVYVPLSLIDQWLRNNSGKPHWFCKAGEFAHPPCAAYIRKCTQPGEWISIGSSNDGQPDRWKAITCINDYKILRCHRFSPCRVCCGLVSANYTYTAQTRVTPFKSEHHTILPVKIRQRPIIWKYNTNCYILNQWYDILWYLM